MVMRAYTKDELVEQLAIANAKVERLADDLSDLDREAKAIARCVQALGPIAPTRTGSHPYTYTMSSEDSRVERVLRYLAQRYGVQLIETRREVMPCDRPHLEDAAEGQLVEALRFRPVGRPF